jgi:hypothetical protein
MVRALLCTPRLGSHLYPHALMSGRFSAAVGNLLSLPLSLSPYLSVRVSLCCPLSVSLSLSPPLSRSLSLFCLDAGLGETVCAYIRK